MLYKLTSFFKDAGRAGFQIGVAWVKERSGIVYTCGVSVGTICLFLVHSVIGIVAGTVCFLISLLFSVNCFYLTL